MHSSTKFHTFTRVVGQHCKHAGFQVLLPVRSNRPFEHDGRKLTLRDLGNRRQRLQCLSSSSSMPLQQGLLTARQEKLRVLLYIPNLLGYARIVLLCAAASIAKSQSLLAYCLFLLNFAADGLDGVLARRLNQVSLYGAFLDILIDNAARGYLWILCAPQPYGFLMMYLEMLTFVCTHAAASSSWKEDLFSSAPRWMKAVMANGFKTFPGMLVVYGLMGLPLWLFAQKYLPHSVFASPFVGLPALFGRMVGAAIECWVVVKHIDGLLSGHSTTQVLLSVEAVAGSEE